MKITITIDTANAAFEGSMYAETARILRKLANDMSEIQASDYRQWPLRDFNGNTVGRCAIEHDDE